MKDVNWRKASYSSANAENCVEMAHLGQVVGIRDSKSPDQPPQRLGLAEAAMFLAAVKRGDHDL
jgi:Domain of unknown function (DUF397)